MNKIFYSLTFPALMLVLAAASAGLIATGLNANQPVAPQVALAPTATSVSKFEIGRRLFLAKGCVVCHTDDKVKPAAASMDNPDIPMGTFGPNLTNLQADPAFLQRWLKNPSAVKPGTEMPNLNLSDGEIEALVAFLTAKQ